jgi:alginate O-acetyltransferase complex protein AlgI
VLFNSLSFLLGFLPVTLLVFFLLGKWRREVAAAWLAAASLFFYAWWDYRYLPLMLASICLNYGAAMRIGAAAGKARKYWLVAAIGANLALLSYYKYADFFVSAVTDLAGLEPAVLHIALPIGISFFTFTQIAFLVDTYQYKVKERRFIHYVLFVSYFPHLVAGPVLHHKEMMPQFARPENYTPHARHFAVGGTIFAIGLAKKVLLADNLAPHANAVFSQADAPTLLIAWGGVLAYAFQLYFDFSGYSDMAIGLSRMLGVRLPLNFNSPYKALNISDFWRRWHMTLSRFLRDYLYIPLGGNRHGPWRRQVNLMTTMVLGGLWHGAGWNFVIWGALHGLYLVINHAWSNVAARLGFPVRSAAWKAAAWPLTFIAVCCAWVFFRAPTLPSALAILGGMAGEHGVALPGMIMAKLGGAGAWLEHAGVASSLGGGAEFAKTWCWVAVAAWLAFLMPNTQEIMRKFRPALDFQSRPAASHTGWLGRRLQWRPTQGWAAATAVLLLAGLLALNRPSDFLYFQF